MQLTADCSLYMFLLKQHSCTLTLWWVVDMGKKVGYKQTGRMQQMKLVFPDGFFSLTQKVNNDNNFILVDMEKGGIKQTDTDQIFAI